MAKSHRMWTVLFAAILLLGLTFVVSAQQQTPTGQQAPTGQQTPTTQQSPIGQQTPTLNVTPSVTVDNQAIIGGTVTVQQVVAAQNGWMTIHRALDGSYGDQIGHAFVPAGTSQNVVVSIDVAQATPTLYAMLHLDAGQPGVYEFPGPDVPVVINGQIVMQPFTVTNYAQLGITPSAGTGTPSAGAETPGTGTPGVVAPGLTTRTPGGLGAVVGAPTVTTGPGTPTSTPVARLPVTGGDGPATPWGLILLVPGVAVLLVGLSMALITRRR